MFYKNFFLLFLSLSVGLLTGFLGSLFTVTNSGGWYDLLSKPTFTPPNYLFGLVWSVLFIFISLALFLILKKDLKDKQIKNALIIFGIQLIFNILWSFFFFYLRNPRLAFLEIIALLIITITMIIKFYEIDKRTLYLLTPYLLWVSFAALLNYYLWILN